MDLEEALQRLYTLLSQPQTTVELKLTEAYGRVLANTVHAPLNLPPFNASAMDGYAVKRQEFLEQPDRAFEFIGESLAGHPFQGRLTDGSCVRVFTGAQVPEGADQVILQEDVLATDNRRIRFAPIELRESYVRRVGHDVTAGSILAEPGDRLHSFVCGSLASAGIDTVTVYPLPRVGVFSTGDELVDPGTPPESLKAGQIYDSNRFTVLNLLRNTPCQTIDLGRLADDPSVVHAAFDEASRNCDVLITSGGVSVGDADFVTDTIKSLGELSFWRLNLKPGKPLAFGRINDCYIFGLPGNPVSTIITLLMLAKPAIHYCAGYRDAQPWRVDAKLTTAVSHPPGRTEFQRGVARMGPQGLQVSVTGDQSSNRLSTFTGANCLIEVPKDSAGLERGENVTILPFDGLLGEA